MVSYKAVKYNIQKKYKKYPFYSTEQDGGQELFNTLGLKIENYQAIKYELFVKKFSS